MTMNTIKNPYKNFLLNTGISYPAQVSGVTKTSPTISLSNVEESSSDNLDSKEQINKKKKLFGIIGISLGSVFLLGTIAFFIITKGFSGNIAKKLTKISDKAQKAIYELNTQSQNLTLTQKQKLKMHKGVRHIADAMQASSNISAVKDSGINHYLRKWGLGKVIDKINVFFKDKIVLKNKTVAYVEAETASVKFCNYLEKIAQETNSPELAQKAKEIMTGYMSKFSTQQHTKRAELVWNNLKGLDEQIYNSLYRKKGGFFKNLKQLRSYLTLDIANPKYLMVQKDLSATKSEISNSLNDVNNNIKQAMSDLKISINSQNNAAVSLIKELEGLLTESKKLNGLTESTERAKLFNEMKENLDKLLNIAKGDLKNQKEFELAEKRISKMYDLIKPQSYKKGIAQKAMTEIKEMFSEGKNSKEYKLANSYLEKMNSKLNYAISQEMTSYEKLAELSVGSAPTDIIGILWPTVLGAVLVVNADSKDKRISKALTQGIPILGGVGVTYYGMLRGFTGAKNLVLGLASMELLNVIGSQVDILVKKYRGEQKKLKAAFESLTKLQKNSDNQNTHTIA